MEPINSGFDDYFVYISEKINKTFDSSELRSLCTELNIDYDDIPWKRKSDAVRELILYCRRHGIEKNLVAVCQALRPHENWLTPEAYSDYPTDDYNGLDNYETKSISSKSDFIGCFVAILLVAVFIGGAVIGSRCSVSPDPPIFFERVEVYDFDDLLPQDQNSVPPSPNNINSLSGISLMKITSDNSFSDSEHSLELTLDETSQTYGNIVVNFGIPRQFDTVSAYSFIPRQTPNNFALKFILENERGEFFHSEERPFEKGEWTPHLTFRGGPTRVL